MRSFLAWLRDVLTGPRCPHPGCPYWARGVRTLHDHFDFEHAGERR